MFSISIVILAAILGVILELLALLGFKRFDCTFRWLSSKWLYLSSLIGTGIWLWLYAESYSYWGGRGVFAELLVPFLLLVYFRTRTLTYVRRFWRLGKLSTEDAKNEQPEVREEWRTVNWNLFLVSAILFLACFPFSVFAHAIGLFPGLVFILAFAYFFTGATCGERSIHSILAIVLLALFVWLWGEAGRQGLVVMPVDLPEGRGDMSFTADGVANALETELKDFGSHETDYGPTEAARIFSKEFPRNLWFKGTEARPPLLEGLQASHVIVGTDVEGFPLFNVYHILRHLRGTPLLEGQILLGEDGSLTLALRRSNAPLECGDRSIANKILKTSLSSWGDGAVEDLSEASVPERASWPKIPDARGCKENWFRWLLERLDVMSAPASSEERLTNITIHDLTGDEALASAIHLAAIEAMSHISPERLAIYYDNTGRAASSLDYYKKALPDLLAESRNAPAILSEYPRQRLASALVRIGDFEKCEDADRAYSLAAHLFPDDLHVQARIGYGYLVRFKQPDPDCKAGDDKVAGATDNSILAASISHLRKAVVAADPNLQQQGGASDTTELYPTKGNLSASRLGLTRWRETLAWASSNLAYALVLAQTHALRTKDKNCSPQLEEILGDPECLGALAARANPRDVRTAITMEYVRMQLSSDAKKPNCDSLPNESVLAKIDPIDPTDPHKTYGGDDSYDRTTATLHNTLLMEDQLVTLYSMCAGDPEDYRLSQAKWLYHQMLLKSLLKLDRIQGRTARPLDFSDMEAMEEYEAEAALLDETKQPASHEFSDQATLQHLFLKATTRWIGSQDQMLSKEDVTFCDVHKNEPRVQSLCARLNSFSCKDVAADVGKALSAANGLPDDYFIRENLGITRLKAGMYKEALHSFQDAVRLRPEDPESRYLLAFALNENDRPQEARDQLRYGELLDPKGWSPQVYSSFLPSCPGVPGYVSPDDVEILELKVKSHTRSQKHRSKLELDRP